MDKAVNPLRKVTLESGSEILSEMHPCKGVHNLCIYRHGDMVGRALIILPLEETPAVLLDIYIYHEKDRRKGLADELMSILTHSYDNLVTGYLSNAGKELCLKHGFELHKSLFKKKPHQLTFKRRSYAKEESREESGADACAEEGINGSAVKRP